MNKITMELQQDENGNYVATFAIPREAMVDRPVREVIVEFLTKEES